MDDKRQTSVGQEMESAEAKGVEGELSVPEESPVQEKGKGAEGVVRTACSGFLALDPESIPPEWREELHHLAGEGGTVLLLGGSDVGKSTFCRALVQKALGAGMKTAVVDADVGQSALGLPGTVTLAVLDASGEREIRPKRKLYFVGALSPRDCLVNHLVATVRACQAAWEEGAKLTVVDTTGYISAPEGALLKRAKINTIRPDVVVALPHKNELQCILDAYVGSTFPRLVILPASPGASLRKRETRRKSRQERFGEYFREAKRIQLSLSDRILLADLPINWKRNRPSLAQLCAKSLGYSVLFATSCCDNPLLITEVECTPTEVESLTVALKTKPRTYSGEQFQNCLVGLVDEEDEPLGVGLLLQVDWQNGVVELLAPPEVALDRVRTLKLGRIRIDAGGSELTPASW
jgi:polynucleotide 5'-hydroxyl-kinase GRC3/NOL9